LLVINNADDPPFATLIRVDRSTGKLTVGARITLDSLPGHAGFDATNGAEQPQFDPASRKFYLSIPHVGDPVSDGAVVSIDTNSTGSVEAVFPVQFCQPAGLTLGPMHDALIGCSVAFDTAGKAWSSTGANSAAPISIIMDLDDGTVDRNVMGV